MLSSWLLACQPARPLGRSAAAVSGQKFIRAKRAVARGQSGAAPPPHVLVCSDFFGRFGHSTGQETEGSSPRSVTSVLLDTFRYWLSATEFWFLKFYSSLKTLLYTFPLLESQTNLLSENHLPRFDGVQVKRGFLTTVLGSVVCAFDLATGDIVSQQNALDGTVLKGSPAVSVPEESTSWTVPA